MTSSVLDVGSGECNGTNEAGGPGAAWRCDARRGQWRGKWAKKKPTKETKGEEDSRGKEEDEEREGREKGGQERGKSGVKVVNEYQTTNG